MVNIEEQLKYIIHNLKYIYVYSKDDYNKLTINIKSLIIRYKCNINKLPNTLIKLIYFVNNNNLNNLPLSLKCLFSYNHNCNLPPNIIYLYCDYCDINNLPRSLQFIYTSNKKIIYAKDLIEHNYNKNKINFIYLYDYLIKLKSIY